jgi:predicted ArsR family transcriptional regulator
MAGRPPDVTDKEILDVFRQSVDPVLFTGEVAGKLSIGRDGVRKRLQELEQQGFIEKKQRGNVIVWWLVNNE